MHILFVRSVFLEAPQLRHPEVLFSLIAGRCESEDYFEIKPMSMMSKRDLANVSTIRNIFMALRRTPDRRAGQ